jgi:hypothetical protein
LIPIYAGKPFGYCISFFFLIRKQNAGRERNMSLHKTTAPKPAKQEESMLLAAE